MAESDQTDDQRKSEIVAKYRQRVLATHDSGRAAEEIFAEYGVDKATLVAWESETPVEVIAEVLAEVPPQPPAEAEGEDKDKV